MCSIPYKNSLPQNLLQCHNSYTVFTVGAFLIALSTLWDISICSELETSSQKESPFVKCSSVQSPLCWFSAHFVASYCLQRALIGKADYTMTTWSTDQHDIDYTVQIKLDKNSLRSNLTTPRHRGKQAQSPGNLVCHRGRKIYEIYTQIKDKFWHGQNRKLFKDDTNMQ